MQGDSSVGVGARLAVVTVTLLLAAAAARGENLVTNSDQFVNPKIIDFSQFAVTCSGFGDPGCVPDVEVGGLVGESVTFSGTNNGFNGASISNLVFGLNNNGSWGAGRNGYVGINNQLGIFDVVAEFIFETPVTDVGAFVNYVPDVTNPPIMQALGAGGVVIDTVDLSIEAPISTPGAVDAGAFRGFSVSTPEIFGIRFTDGFTVIDDLTFSRTETPPGWQAQPNESNATFAWNRGPGLGNVDDTSVSITTSDNIGGDPAWASTDQFTINPSETYSVEGFVLTNDGQARTPRVEFFNASGASLGSIGGDLVTTIASATWTSLSYLITPTEIPAGTATASVEVLVGSDDAGSGTASVTFDDVTVTENDTELNLVTNPSFDETVEVLSVIPPRAAQDEVVTIFDNAQQPSVPTTAVARLANPPDQVVRYNQTICAAPDPRFDPATGVYADEPLDIRSLDCDIDVEVYVQPEYKAFPNVNGIPTLVVVVTEAIGDPGLPVGPIIDVPLPEIYADYLDGLPACGSLNAPLALTAALPGELPYAEAPGFVPTTYRCNRTFGGRGRFSIDVAFVFEDTTVKAVETWVVERYISLNASLRDRCIDRRYLRTVSRAVRNIQLKGSRRDFQGAFDDLEALLVDIDGNESKFANCPVEDNLWGAAYAATLVAAGSTFEKILSVGQTYNPPNLPNLPVPLPPPPIP